MHGQAVAVVFLAGWLTACSSWGPFWETTATLAPQKCSHVASSIATVCVPANTTGFSMGSVAAGFAPVHTVAAISAFSIGRYEIKYAEWLSVRVWATSNGYTFADAGIIGSANTGSDQQPVTTVSWRDAMVWSNAASQKEGFTPVYYADAGFSTVLKTATAAASVNAAAGSQDNPYVRWTANGYRLPTEAEWEYAARYVEGADFLRGDAPSGWLDNNPPNGAVDGAEVDILAWHTANTAVTHPAGEKSANSLGAFDMNGNVHEHVWDWDDAYTTASPYTDADSKGPASSPALRRIIRGGGYASAQANMLTARRDNCDPWVGSDGIGFRIARRP